MQQIVNKMRQKWVNPEGYCEGVPFWCDKCLGAENEGEEEEGCDRQFFGTDL